MSDARLRFRGVRSLFGAPRNRKRELGSERPAVIGEPNGLRPREAPPNPPRRPMSRRPLTDPQRRRFTAELAEWQADRLADRHGTGGELDRRKRSRFVFALRPGC